MADTKITQLQPPQVGYPVVPATDVLPIVVIADPGMATSGSTRKVTVNQLLGAGGTATLASATITGDLTVDTNTLKVDSGNDRVGVGTASPTSKLHVSNTGAVTRITITDDTTNGRSGYIESNFSDALVIGTTSGVRAIRFSPDSKPYYQIATDGVQTWLDGIGGTRMTLNSTGLGVGASPELKLRIIGSDEAPATSGTSTTNGALRIGGANTNLCIDSGVCTTGGIYGWFQSRDRSTYASNYDLVLQKNGGNVGIGVTSPSNRLEVQEAGTGSGLGGIVSSTATVGGNAGYIFRTGGTNRWSLSLTGSAGAESIRFYDVNNSATRLLIDTSGNVISNVTGTAPTLATNSQMVFNLTSNTNLRVSVRGSDGVTRVANITLA